MKKNSLTISQSFLKEFWNEEVCHKSLAYRYIDGLRSEPTDAMINGLYFEYYLIGATRGGQIPNIDKLKSGEDSKREIDLKELINNSKPILDKLGIKIMEAQADWKYEDLTGHPDLIAEINNEIAIIDIKWTGLRYDDKWRGWENIKAQPDKLWQPTHYVYMYEKLFNKRVPFYYLIFGKSGWVRFYKVNISDDKLQQYDNIITETRKDILDLNIEGWKARPEYNKCKSCNFKDICKDKATIPLMEEIYL